jgi:hypothetical protein
MNPMLEKVLLFGVGYVLGAKAGKERFNELMGALQGLAGRREVATVVGLVSNLIEERLAA